MERRFNLRQSVVLVTLTTVILAHGVLAYTLSRYVAAQMISREGQQAQEFLNSIVKAEDTADILFTAEGRPALTSFVRHLGAIPGLLRANVYGTDKIVRYSTEAGLVGTVPAEADDLELALDGQVITSLNSDIGDTTEAKSLGILPEEGRVIEGYLPILSNSKRVVGVVEYYRDAAPLQQVLSNLTWIVWGAAAMSGLLIVAALYGATTRAMRKIVAQTSELQGLSVMASLGQMAAAVTHSLRNPLASIRSSIELLQLSRPGEVDDTAADILSEIDRIDRQVRDLLDFAGSDEGRPVPVALAPVVADAVGRMTATAQKAGVVIETDTLDPGLTVMAEPRLLIQVLESLFTNAIEAMPGGGRVHVTALTQGQGLRLTVADQGPGLPAVLLGGAPMPFVTTKVRGLGLGLSISQKLLERCGGSMSFANAPGGGANVAIHLKRAPATA